MNQSEMSKMSPEDQIKQLEFELLIMGFAVAKTFSILTEKPRGVMECPLCKGKLHYSTASSNGHFHASCETEGCIKASE